MQLTVKYESIDKLQDVAKYSKSTHNAEWPILVQTQTLSRPKRFY